jgi:hypothetical protein
MGGEEGREGESELVKLIGNLMVLIGNPDTLL